MFSLSRRHPNPAIHADALAINVVILDNLLGQHVQTLVDTEQTIGRHTVLWYGRDKAGMNVASGVYFMHMTTSAGKIQTKKVMLLR